MNNAKEVARQAAWKQAEYNAKKNQETTKETTQEIKIKEGSIQPSKKITRKYHSTKQEPCKKVGEEICKRSSENLPTH